MIITNNDTFIPPGQDQWLSASIRAQLFEFAQRATDLMRWQQQFTQALDQIPMSSMSALDGYSKCHVLLQAKQATLTGMVQLLSEIYQYTQSDAVAVEPTKQQAWRILAEWYVQLGTMCEELNSHLTLALAIPFTLPVTSVAYASSSMAQTAGAMAANTDERQGNQKRTRYCY